MERGARAPVGNGGRSRGDLPSYVFAWTLWYIIEECVQIGTVISVLILIYIFYQGHSLQPLVVFLESNSG
jgi:hypothetical protein